MKAYMQQIILPSQTKFVSGRCIYDNIFLANKAITYALESNKNLVILLLDFGNAYDKVSWPFLRLIFQQYKFIG